MAKEGLAMVNGEFGMLGAAVSGQGFILRASLFTIHHSKFTILLGSEAT